MRIQEAINSRQLPKISKAEMIAICKGLNIPITDTNYDTFNLTSDQLERLRYSKDLHVILVSQEMTSAHKDMLGKFTKLSKKYEDLSKRMAGKAYLSEDKAVIDALRNGLDASSKEYQTVINNLNIKGKNISKFFSIGAEYDPTLSNFNQGRVENINERVEKREKKLVEEYKQLDELRQKSTQYKSKFKKAKNEARMKKVQARIEKLQAKQGKLQTKQKRIINKGASKYISKREKEIERYLKTVEREMAFVEKKIQNKQLQSTYTHDLRITEQELKDLEGKKGIKAAMQRTSLKRDKRKLTHQINQLKRKQGRCNLSNQFSRSVSIEYVR